jgi:hypothetical protein
MAQEHCPLGQHSEVLARLAATERGIAEVGSRITQHTEQNGHVTRREIDNMVANIHDLTVQVAETGKLIAGLQTQQALTKAALSTFDKAIIFVGTPVMSALVALLMKYLLK